MIFKVGNDRAADYIQFSFRNVDGAGSMTIGRAIAYAVDGNSATGVNAVFPAATSFKSFAGIVVATDIPINGWGLVQAYGQCASALISNEGTSITITAGNALIPIGQAGLSSVGGATMDWLNSKYVTGTQTIAVSAALFFDNVVVRAV